MSKSSFPRKRGTSPIVPVQIGSGKNRQRIPFEGNFLEACKARTTLLQQMDSTPDVVIAPVLKEMFTPFMHWYKNEVAASTIEDCTDTINLYIHPHFGVLRPNQLTLELIESFKNKLLEKGLSPTTINKHLNYFSKIIKWGVANKKCQPVGFELPRFPKKKTIAEKKIPLTKRQLDKIYKHIQPKYRLLFLLMSDMGLRLSEALNLQVENVLEEFEQIYVVGKGNKPRKVPYMSDRFIEELEKVLEDRVEGYLVINPETGKPYATMRRELLRAVKAAEIERTGINHHLLRHTFATLCAKKGINAHALQKIMGHESIETTNKIYTNIDMDFISDEARKMRRKDTSADTPKRPRPANPERIKGKRPSLSVVNGGKR